MVTIRIPPRVTPSTETPPVDLTSGAQATHHIVYRSPSVEIVETRDHPPPLISARSTTPDAPLHMTMDNAQLPAQATHNFSVPSRYWLENPGWIGMSRTLISDLQHDP